MQVMVKSRQLLSTLNNRDYQLAQGFDNQLLVILRQIARSACVVVLSEAKDHCLFPINVD